LEKEETDEKRVEEGVAPPKAPGFLHEAEEPF
jgi:hypothetical protein